MWWMPLVQPIFQFVSTITFILVFIVLFDRKRAQKLPEYQALRLEQFARMAVNSVEHENPVLSVPAKRQAAITRTASLFVWLDLPVPKEDAIGIAVSAAMHTYSPLGNTTQQLSE